MRLTRHSDYAMRVLLYLGSRPDERCSIADISTAYDISRNHLMKVVNSLVNAGFLVSARGRHGGIHLADAPQNIRVGAVIRHTEDSFALVDCEHCLIATACALTCVLREAVDAFLTVLDGYTLADLLAGNSTDLSRLLTRA